MLTWTLWTTGDLTPSGGSVKIKERRAALSMGQMCVIFCRGDNRKKLDVKDIRKELENTVEVRTN